MDENFNDDEKICKEIGRLAYLEKEYQVANERCKILKSMISTSEKYLNYLGYNISNSASQKHLGDESYANLSVIEASCKLLAMRGELTTREIFKELGEKGKTWAAKNPLNSLSAALHNADKGRIKSPIVKVGPSKWRLKD